MGVEPFQQRAAGVQAHLQIRIALEHVQERQVAVLIRLLEDVVEVADGLVVVQDEDEADGECDIGRWCARGAK